MNMRNTSRRTTTRKRPQLHHPALLSAHQLLLEIIVWANNNLIFIMAKGPIATRVVATSTVFKPQCSVQTILFP
ncbi:hypothetical protein CLOM_g16720 [Closterium sp. NIES-68]|nr:hypothetical protein CLOM_g16720 [Closterium sp. NIES-68]